VNAGKDLLDLYENLDLDAVDICKPANIGEIRSKSFTFFVLNELKCSPTEARSSSAEVRIACNARAA
jgi:hypothetical protein